MILRGKFNKETQAEGMRVNVILTNFKKKSEIKGCSTQSYLKKIKKKLVIISQNMELIFDMCSKGQENSLPILLALNDKPILSCMKTIIISSVCSLAYVKKPLNVKYIEN